MPAELMAGFLLFFALSGAGGADEAQVSWQMRASSTYLAIARHSAQREANAIIFTTLHLELILNDTNLLGEG